MPTIYGSQVYAKKARAGKKALIREWCVLPAAKRHKRVRYFTKNADAERCASIISRWHKGARVVAYERGFAVQLRKSGPYLAGFNGTPLQHRARSAGMMYSMKGAMRAFRRSLKQRACYEALGDLLLASRYAAVAGDNRSWGTVGARGSGKRHGGRGLSLTMRSARSRFYSVCLLPR